MKKAAEIGSQEDLTLMYEDLLVVLGELTSEAPKIKKLYRDIKTKFDEQDIIVKRGIESLQSVADREYDRIIKERDKLLDRTDEMLKKMEAVSEKLNQSITKAAPIIQSVQSFEEYRKSLEARLAAIEANQKNGSTPNLPSQIQPRTATGKKITELTTDEISRRTNGRLSEEDVVHLICQMTEKGLSEDEMESLFTRMIKEKMTQSEFLREIAAKVVKKKYDIELPQKAASSHIDYDEINTIKNLYDKYHKYVDGPFLVVRKSWYRDYCFAVETFQRNNTWVRGKTFSNGVLDRVTSHHADTEEFRMYNGPSAEKIKSQL